MDNTKEKFLQSVKETICALDGHKYDGGDVKTEHISEYKTTCFIFKCARCRNYVACAVKDNYVYPIEMDFKFY